MDGGAHINEQIRCAERASEAILRRAGGDFRTASDPRLACSETGGFAPSVGAWETRPALCAIPRVIPRMGAVCGERGVDEDVVGRCGRAPLAAPAFVCAAPRADTGGPPASARGIGVPSGLRLGGRDSRAHWRAPRERAIGPCQGAARTASHGWRRSLRSRHALPPLDERAGEGRLA
jgi:hypothetical protein